MGTDNQTVEKEKKIGRIGFWTKVWAVIIQVICSLLVVACAATAIYYYERGYYRKNFYQILYSVIGDNLWDDVADFIDAAEAGNTSNVEAYIDGSNITFVRVIGKYSANVMWEYGDKNTLYDSAYVYKNELTYESKHYICTVVMGHDFMMPDNYRNLSIIYNILYTVRYLVYVIAALSVVGWVLLYVFLLRNAGYAKGSDTPKPIFESYIPFEIDVVAFILAGGAFLFFIENVGGGLAEALVLLCVAGVIYEVFFILWSICLAIRIKTKFLWKTMLLRWIIKGIGWLFKKMPLIWQAVVGGVLFNGALLLASLCIGNFRIWTGVDLLGWCLMLFLLAVLFALVLYISLTYRKIEDKIHKLASGDVSGDVDQKLMLPIFKRTADDLKTISGGIVISNEKRLASEKTQSALITNVSHDIKTPLTSIINYADLISKENCDNEKVNEYAEVLGRQSTRLKRLLEDLIEVSKAQSGALEVNLQSCEVATLINQAAGEFEEKLRASNLDLITKGTEKGIMIMADPRRMWRVFDNLLGNICKYSQPGTRVYLNVEENNGKCFIVFKNTSSRELDMSPEELMARFVRGDKSREGAEGNGLGLSIASNLVQLQKGNMEISIDGDLFKVTLEFPSEGA